MMTSLGQDIRYAARMLWKTPGITVVAVVALALGIGANTAIFSVVNTVLLRPLPYRDPERLVMLWENHPQAGRMGVAGLNYLEWKKELQSFENSALFVGSAFDLAGVGDAEQVEGTSASASFFDTIGVRATLGRTFSSGEDSPEAKPVVVLSYGLWQRRLSGSSDAIGKTINLNDEPHTIIGVMPQDFADPAELWKPLINDPQRLSAGGRSMMAIARLKPEVTLVQAQSEIDTIARRLEQARPEFNTGWSVRLVPLHEQVTGGVRTVLLVLLGAVGLVLLIACANVANLLLARTLAREREIAIRMALGASRARIVRQLLVESLLLALTGGAFGLLLALWGVDLLLALSPADLIPRADEIGIDAQVLGFTLIVSLLTSVIFGLAPAILNARANLSVALKEGAKTSVVSFGRGRLRASFIVAEVALSLVLLVGAGLLIKSFIRLTQIDPGFKADNVLMVGIPLSETRYREDAQVINFYDEMLGRVRSLPGVEAAGTTHTTPLGGSDSNRPFVIQEQPRPEPGKEPGASYRVISPDYFRAMGIPIIKGRDFTDADNAQAQGMVMINETMARRYWRDGNALGQQIRQGAVGGESPWLTIIGIVGNVRHAGLDAEPKPEMYFTFAQAAIQRSSSIVYNRRRIKLAIRTAAAPEQLADAVRREISSVDKNQPINSILLMNEYVTRSVAPQRFNMLMLGIFATLALVLAIIGVYGVMSYSIMQRTREIGIRMALGAQKSDVLKMAVGQGMMLVAVGIALGIAASLMVTRFMTSLLYGVSATDPATFAAIALLFGAVALVACYVPARRAARVDPMVALRYE